MIELNLKRVLYVLHCIRRGLLTDQTTDLEQSTVPSSVAIAGRFSNLQRTDRIIAEISVRPRWPVYVFTGTAVLVAWVWIFVLAAGVSDTNGSSQLGPGMSLFGVVFDTIDLKASQFPFLLWVLKICTPSSVPELSWAIYFSTLSMWVCMSLAMMLPSALPLIRTYSDIADVAAAKGEGVVSVGYLLLGYMVVWGLFCIVMSVAQLSLVGLGIAADPIYPIEGVIGGLLLIIAGIYQFSELKNACLEKCRNPFSYLFGKWSQEKIRRNKTGLGTRYLLFGMLLGPNVGDACCGNNEFGMDGVIYPLCNR